MKTLLVPFLALFSGLGLLMLGNALLGTLLGVRAVALGFSIEIIGVVMAAHYAGFITGALVCVQLIERVGHIRTFAALCAIASAATLSHILLEVPLAWGMLRAITGFCFAGLYMVTESWLNDRSENTNRGRILSTYMIVILVSSGAGQLFLLAPNPGGFELFSIAAIMIALGLVPVALTTSPAPAPHRANPMALALLFKTSPLGITGCFASGLALGSFWSMAPVFARMLEFSKASTAIFMLLTIFGGLALVWPIGWLSDRMDRRQAITLLCAAGASTSLALVLVGVEFSPALMGLVTLFGGFTFPLYSISVAHANDFLEPDELISASSGLLLVYGAGAIIGPIMAGLIMGWMGAKGLYAMNAGVMGLIVLHAVYRMQMRATIPNEEQDAVVFIPRTTHVAYENDTLIIDSSDWPEAHTSGSPPSDEELCPNLVFEDLKRSGVSG
jgi:MFS family permease